MNKVISGLAVLAAFVFLVGCRSTTSTSQPTPSHYWTALEAYEQIRPAMLNWHEDAVVVNIGAVRDERPEWQVQRNGTALAWSFMVSSSNAEKTTEIVLRGDQITLGVNGLPEVSMTTDKSLPLDDMIDSDEAVEIALRHGVDASGVLRDICTSNYDGKAGRAIPMSWELEYLSPHDEAKWSYIFINIVTGEVIHNDFTYTPPPPTPTSKPGSDQLLIRAYGEFDLYITNPQGQSLGIEPDSGESITEIPDAGYDPDSDVMTEDSIHLASALIMNPVEGRYRVQLHGPGEPEKRCRWSVEVRKGTGEEMLREVEIPCQEGVSLVYEFTLSLSGEELLSDVTPVEE